MKRIALNNPGPHDCCNYKICKDISDTLYIVFAGLDCYAGDVPSPAEEAILTTAIPPAQKAWHWDSNLSPSPCAITFISVDIICINGSLDVNFEIVMQDASASDEYSRSWHGSVPLENLNGPINTTLILSSNDTSAVPTCGCSFPDITLSIME